MAHGFWSGAYSTCSTQVCSKPGACCTPDGCVQTSIEKCVIEGGEFAGFGTLCSDVPPPCPGCQNADDCIDNNACTLDQCKEGQCFHEPISGCCLTASDCADGNPCTVDFCLSNHSCIYKYKLNCCESDEECNDGNECTSEWCDLDTGDCFTQPVPNQTPCAMGKFYCEDGVCSDTN